jgi:malate dehydrogenase (oxaloacetate-decarboxylating)|tara:strand:- start:7617 stop:8951 length:1335 start_codon:yes stop_codon:yes gene_type:complete
LSKRDTHELEKAAQKPGEDALKLHPFYKGKIETMLKCSVKSLDDFAVWYSPGVAAPCKDISNNKEKVFEHTNRGNSVAIVSDGSRVLGLGDIGPEAGLPVMEGKALLFKYLGGVDAVPIMLDTKDKDEIIRFCKVIAPTFGGINLEDIESPKCFDILSELQQTLPIPIWHDDQQGTALVVIAGLINSAKFVNKKFESLKISLIGSGAANVALVRLLGKAGVNLENISVVDSRGIINLDRNDLQNHPAKWNIAKTTNKEQITGGIKESLQNADACIALSKPGPDVIEASWIKDMSDSPIVFACANPVPEIWPWDATKAGAAIVATGRSDFPNQVNNSLGFPGLFRGALDVRALKLTDGMCLAAASEIASYAEKTGLSENHIVPTMEALELFAHEAAAVAMQAIDEGVAQIKLDRSEVYENALEVITRSRNITKNQMDSGFIKPAP